MGKREEPKMQSEKFKAMAKELEADGDEKAFDKKLKALSQKVKKPTND
jgi:hypothetical protein